MSDQRRRWSTMPGGRSRAHTRDSETTNDHKPVGDARATCYKLMDAWWMLEVRELL